MGMGHRKNALGSSRQILKPVERNNSNRKGNGMSKRWNYSGDVNLEYGGVFIDISDWENGYATAVRVQPYSDAGLQNNAWWIEELTVIKPRSEQELKSVLDSCGWTIDPKDSSLVGCGGEVVAAPNTKEFRLAIADSCIGYGLYDTTISTSVQIGQTDPYHDGETLTADETLRSNASLSRYVRRNFLQRL
jgi:hypothetical protein